MENALTVSPLAAAIGTQLISTPHPITLEGQRNLFAAMLPGESLDSFLRRTVDDFDGHAWAISIGGVEVPREIWAYIHPKEGQIIELVGDPGRQALFMIAIVVLTIYTSGLASAVLASSGGAFGLGAAGTFGALAGIAAVQFAGTLLINKLLGPKLQSNKNASGIQQYQTYSLSSTNNAARPYQPVGILFGSYMVAPDFLGKPYSWYNGNEQFVAMHLGWGIGVDHYDELYLGTTKLTDYLDDTQKWDSGFTGVADQPIPLFGNVDTQDGAPLQDGTGALQTVTRTSSLNTVRIGWDFAYQTYTVDGKGRITGNADAVVCQYRAVGAPSWITYTQSSFPGNSTKVYRRSIYADVAEGQYETRCYRLGQDNKGANAVCQITLSTLTSIQKDTSTYTGIARTAIQMRASSQLNGTPDQVNAVAHSTPIPVWKGTGWVVEESNNPGAQMLKYLRGYFDTNGKLIAGCGYTDAEIDIPALQAFMLYCAAEGFTYDYWMTQDRTHLQMLEALAQAGMGEYTDAMGLHSVIWVAKSQPVDAIVNMSRIQKDSFKVDYTLLGTSDGVVATYVDKTQQPWAEVTIQIPSPTSGTTTITNPANVTLEGVTSEAHAAKLARLLMAQQVYQYKGVEYGTSFEWLTYRRYSIVQMQHDLTQWGYGGNVLSCVLDGTGHATLQLNAVVPPPTAGNAYIGLRIPGEAAYRVFTVNGFAAPTDTISLVETWPNDARVPGDDAADNPAFDTLWIYDFKQTPGLACRVISVQPQGAFKGATISIVPESDEFWTYVETGAYTPPKGGTLLPARPVASALVLTEQQEVIGNVAATVMHANFSISGAAGEVLVYSDLDVQGEMQLVASLRQERNASWRVDENRQYTVTVRPFTPDGLAGVPTTSSYTPALPNQPPTNIDTFTITDKGDGMRTYAWGFLPGTNQSPNMAGVAIRYIAGNVSAPDWTAMVDLAHGGTPDYFTSGFTTSEPGGGLWTFAVRTVNTDGILSTAMLIKTVTLSDDIGAIQQGVQQAFTTVNQQVAQLNTDTSGLRTDVDGAIAQVQVLQGQVGDILQADTWVATTAYVKGDLVQSGGQLFRSLIDGNLNHQPTASTTDANWEYIGNYASLGEAVGANAANIATVQNTVTQQDGRITANSQSISQNAAAIGTKADASALQATNATVTQQGNSITAVAQDVSLLGAHNAGKTAFVLNQGTVQVDSSGTTLGQYMTSVQAANTAVNARVDSEHAAWTNGDAANASAITAVSAGTISPNVNYCANPNGDNGVRDGWNQATGAAVLGSGGWTNGWLLIISGGAAGQDSVFYYRVTNTAAQYSPWCAGAEVGVGNLTAGSYFYLALAFFDASNTQIGGANTTNLEANTTASRTNFYVASPAPPAGTKYIDFRLVLHGAVAAGSNISIRGVKIEASSKPTAFTADASVSANASATQALTTTVSNQGGQITANANAIQAVSVRMPGGTGTVATASDVTAVQNQVNATNTVMLDVNGRVSGVVQQNNGQTSSFDVLADRFSVSAPNGGASTVFSGGNWRVYDAAGTLRVRMGVW